MTFRREYFSVAKPIAANYTVPGGAVCIQVRVPDSDAHIAILQGMMAKLTDTETWQGDDVDRPIMAELWQEAYVETDWSNCVTPSQAGGQSRVTFWHRWDEISSGAAAAPILDAAQIWGHYITQSPPAGNDTGMQKVWLPAGDYEVRVVYVRLANNCKLTFRIVREADGDTLNPINQVDISGATLRNQVLSASFTLAEPGEYTCYWFAAAAGVTSGGFNKPLTCTELWKVADA